MKKSSGIGVGVFTVTGDLARGDPALVAKRAEELASNPTGCPNMR